MKLLILGLLLTGCTFEAEAEPDPITCVLDGPYCNCTGTVDTAASISDAAGKCAALRKALP